MWANTSEPQFSHFGNIHDVNFQLINSVSMGEIAFIPNLLYTIILALGCVNENDLIRVTSNTSSPSQKISL